VNPVESGVRSEKDAWRAPINGKKPLNYCFSVYYYYLLRRAL